MPNLPTLPSATGPQRKPTPLPALATESDARLQAALAASARAEASLTGLVRAIQHLGTGVGGAREANESLTLELEALRDMLGATGEQQHVFSQKIDHLETALERARKEFERDRQFLIEQQDAFLVQLLDEQEVELKRRDSDLDTLRGRLAELERGDMVTVPPPFVPLASLRGPAIQVLESGRATDAADAGLERAEWAELERTAQKLAEDRERARETMARLQSQRDEAQAAVVRITQERDAAQSHIHRLKSELGGPRIPLSTRPPSGEGRRDSVRGLVSTSALTLDQLEMEARLHRPTATSTASSPVSSSPISSGRAPSISSVLSPPRSNPNASPIPSRLSPPPSRLSPVPARHSSPPPEELRRALTAPPSVQSSTSNRPPLKQKPDHNTRPLVGYSLSTERLESERREGVRLSSKPPGDKR